MIYIDSDELKSSSITKKHLPDKFIEVANLEALTGSDAMVSIGNYPKPTTEKFIKLHIKSGAVLVQIKHGHDLTSSFGTRINECIWRMQQTGAKSWQMVILFVGFANADKDGLLMVNNQYSHNEYKKATYKQYLGAKMAIRERGATFEEIVSARHLPNWIQLQENHLQNFKQKKLVWPDKPILYKGFGDFNPMQSLEKVNDFRIPLMTINGLGEKRVQNLYRWMIANKKPMTLRSAINCLCTEHKTIINEIDLWGSKTVESVWNWYDKKGVIEIG